MIQIRDWLWTGRYIDTQDITKLNQRKIGAILTLHQDVNHASRAVLFLPIIEGHALIDSTIAQGVDFIKTQYQAGQPLLIACSAGLCRSALFAIAALKQLEEQTLLGAFRQLHAIHPQAMPDHQHWADLCRYYQEDIPFWMIWHDSLNTNR